MSDSINTKPIQKIIFYDLHGDVPEKTFSRFTRATHWSFVYKGLPFDRKLVELADITTLSEKIGFAKTIRDGEKLYTLPAIEDPNTGAKVSDSFDIAEYLDKTYADEGRPLLLPPGTRPLQKAFLAAIEAHLPTLTSFYTPAIYTRVSEYSQQRFRDMTLATYGKQIEDIRPTGDEESRQWAKAKQVFDTYNTWFEEGKGSQYLTGDAPVLADFYLAGQLSFLRAVLGRDSKEWQDISSWHGGRWGTFLERVSKEYSSDQ